MIDPRAPRATGLDWLGWVLLAIMAAGALRMVWTFAAQMLHALQGFAP